MGRVERGVRPRSSSHIDKEASGDIHEVANVVALELGNPSLCQCLQLGVKRIAAVIAVVVEAKRSVGKLIYDDGKVLSKVHVVWRSKGMTEPMRLRRLQKHLNYTSTCEVSG